jgi:hypothetical protein
LRESGCYAAETTYDDERVCLKTFDSMEESTHTYDTAAWRFGWPKPELNFPNEGSRQEVEYLVPEVRMTSREEEKKHRSPCGSPL